MRRILGLAAVAALLASCSSAGLATPSGTSGMPTASPTASVPGQPSTPPARGDTSSSRTRCATAVCCGVSGSSLASSSSASPYLRSGTADGGPRGSWWVRQRTLSWATASTGSPNAGLQFDASAGLHRRPRRWPETEIRGVRGMASRLKARGMFANWAYGAHQVSRSTAHQADPGGPRCMRRMRRGDLRGGLDHIA